MSLPSVRNMAIVAHVWGRKKTTSVCVSEACMQRNERRNVSHNETRRVTL